MGRMNAPKAAALAALTLCLSSMLVTCDNSIDLKANLTVEIMKANDRYLRVTQIDIPEKTTFSPTGTISVYFDRPIDMATVSPSTVIIAKSDGTAVEYPEKGITYVADANLVRIRVYPFLDMNTDFSIKIAGVRGMDGSAMHELASDTFRTLDVLAGSIQTLKGSDPRSSAGFTVTEFADLTFQINDKYRYIKYRLSLKDNPGVSDTDWSALSPFIDLYTLTDGAKTVTGLDLSAIPGYEEGDRDLTIQFYGNDTGSGTPSEGLSDTEAIFVDTVAPSAGTLAVGGGSSWVNNSVAAVSMSVEPLDPGDSPSGITGIAFSNDGLTWSAYVPLAPTYEWNLVSGAGGSEDRGGRTVYARVRDAAGNVSAAAADTVGFDDVPPMLPAPQIEGSGYTKDSAVSLAWTTEPSDGLSGIAGLELSNNGTDWSVLTAAANPLSWNLLSGAGGSAAEGTRTVSLRARDAAGNVSATVSAAVVYDVTSPSAGTWLINGGNAYVNSPAVSLTASVNASDSVSGVESIRYSNDGNAWSEWEALAQPKAWNLALDAGGSSDQGSKTVWVTVRDRAGNLSEASQTATIYDSIAPSAPQGLDLAAADDTGISNTDNITSATAAITISGTAEALSSVSVTANGAAKGTVTASGEGAWSMDLALTEGTWAIAAKATDPAGNAGSFSSSLSVTVDTTAPLSGVPDLSPADDSGSSSSDNLTRYTTGLTFAGLTEANARVTLLNGSATVTSGTAGTSGVWSFDASLPAGTHSLRAVATDAAGNAATSGALTVTVDTSTSSTVPDLASADDSGLSVTDNITKNTSGLTFSGTTEAGATVSLYNGATLLGSVTTTSTAWTKDLSLAAGSYSISAHVTDAAGNTYTSAGLALTVDTTAPGAPVVTQTTAATVRTPTISWTSGGNGGGGTYYRWSTDSTWTATTMPGSFTQGTALADGSYTFMVFEYDLPWNYSTTSKTITINAPPNPPAVSGPTSPTLDPTPTWTWTSGGFGNGNFRYQINSTIGSWTTTTAKTYTPSSSLADGNYTLYVEEQDAGGEWSTYGSRTERVTQLIPYNGQTSVPRKPVMQWRSALGALDYTIQVSMNGTTWANFITVSGTSYTVTTALSSLTKYYWRIRNNGKVTTYTPSSGSYYFTTGTR